MHSWTRIVPVNSHGRPYSTKMAVTCIAQSLGIVKDRTGVMSWTESEHCQAAYATKDFMLQACRLQAGQKTCRLQASDDHVKFKLNVGVTHAVCHFYAASFSKFGKAALTASPYLISISSRQVDRLGEVAPPSGHDMLN